MIRDAEITDIPALMDIGHRLIEQTPYKGIEIDREIATRQYGQCLASALGFARVADRDGEITGVLLGFAERLWFSKARYASDLLFYSADGRSGLALLRSFVEWAWSVPGVVEVTCGQSSGMNIDRTGVLYRRVGFQQVGGLWTQTRQNSSSPV